MFVVYVRWNGEEFAINFLPLFHFLYVTQVLSIVVHLKSFSLTNKFLYYLRGLGPFYMHAVSTFLHLSRVNHNIL